jgi:signal transduction histidine kinase
LSARRENGTVVVAVADRGPGIPPGEQARIFDRFSRADGADRRNGVGLGLAIVRAIAEAHGGSVGVRSEPGRGATFELRLPLPGQERENVQPRASRT